MKLTEIGRYNGKLKPNEEFNKKFKVEVEEAPEYSTEEDLVSDNSISSFLKSKTNRNNLLIYMSIGVGCSF